jgi:hypothetical protein
MARSQRAFCFVGVKNPALWLGVGCSKNPMETAAVQVIEIGFQQLLLG